MRSEEVINKIDKIHLNLADFGRDDRIRTCGPLVPNQMRYQAALHPDCHIEL